MSLPLPRRLAPLLALAVVLCAAQAQSPGAPEEATEYRYKSPVPAGNAFLAEHFDIPEAVSDRWVKSEAKKDGEAEEAIAKYDGQFEVEAVEDEKLRLNGDMGLVLKTKARHHAISAALARPFMFDHRPLIVQYEVQFQNGMECGGAYLKMISQPSSGATSATGTSKLLKGFNDKTRYTIMFGPDKCGTQQKLHLILQHKNQRTGVFEEKHWKSAHNAGGAINGKFLDVFTDKKAHQYTLILSPDNTFEIQIDGRTEAKGHMLEDFDPSINPPREIEDTNDSKPNDWDEREKIPDPDARKPEDWDEDEPKEIADPQAEKPIGWLVDEPLLVADPDAKQPADWDEDMDGMWEAPLVDNPKCKDVGCGEWKAPMIANPKFKGKWRAPTIDNPAYKGKWMPRKIANPDYFEDANPFRSLQPIVAVGFELWSMSDGIFFDNLLVTDDRAVVTQWSEDGFQTKRRMLSKGSGESYFNQAFVSFVDYSTQYPWLWAVYVLVIGVPVALLISYCCMSRSTTPNDEPARRKKTDLEEDDDEEEEPLVAEDDKAEEDHQPPVNASGDSESPAPSAEESSEGDAPVATPKSGKSSAAPSKAASKPKSKAEVPEVVEEIGAGEGGSSSAKARRRKQRKE